MASLITFIAVLIATVTIFIRYSYSLEMNKASDSPKYTVDKQTTSQHPMTDTDIRKGLTDQATLELTTEIARIENNLSRMKKSSPHYRPLSESVARMKSILKKEGYEMVDYLAHPYSPDIKATMVFFPDEEINKSEAVIFSVQKPRVNYGGKTIQQGHVTVVHSLLLLQHPKWVLSSIYKKIQKMTHHTIPKKIICCN